MRRTAKYGDAWYPIGTNPQFPMDTLTRFKAGVAKLRGLTEKAGRDPAAVGLAYRVSSNPEAQPKGTVDGERKLFTGGAADYAGDIKALRDVGVTAFDFGLFGADAEATRRQPAPVPGRRHREGPLIMQLGITVGMSGPHPKLDMEMILEAERLGFSQVWTGEAYSTDAVSPAAWILARTTKIKAGTGIMQMPARTPACAAMTVLSLAGAVGKPVHLRDRAIGASGGRGLARRAVRQADAAHEGIHRHHQADSGARETAGVPRRAIFHPV